MVNDIFERWAIARKPRSYTEWILQYQEMLETLPRQETPDQHIKHYFSSDTWKLIEETYYYKHEASDEERKAMHNIVRKASNNQKKD